MEFGDPSGYQARVSSEHRKIFALLKEPKPTILVIPDAVLRSQKEYYQLQQQMLRHCGHDMKNRIAILDIFDGYATRKGDRGDIIEAFRSGIGNNNLSYAAAYYPWVETNIISEKVMMLRPELISKP